MPANLENSAVATGLEKVSFYSNPKEGQCQRMFKLAYNCAHFTCQQGNAQNPSSQASTVCEPGTSRWSSWIQKRQKNQRPNCHQLLDHRKSKGIPEKHLLFSLTMLKPLTVDHNKLWKILKEMGTPDNLTCLLRNLYTGQEATIRTRQGKNNGPKFGKEYVKAVYCHPVYLTYMQSISCEMPGWMNHKLDSRLPGEVSTTSICRQIPL